MNESWNGTSWTEVSNLNTARGQCGASGTQALALVYGGTPESEPTPTSKRTESWDGTSWSQVAELATAATAVSGSPAGTSSLALKTGGTPQTSSQASTEEWTIVDTVKTVTVS